MSRESTERVSPLRENVNARSRSEDSTAHLWPHVFDSKNVICFAFSHMRLRARKGAL